jgi:pre-mRNA-splicing helicase BRR2
MSNKSCQLTPGSYRTAHDGFEEVHIPAPRTKNLDSNEKYIAIIELPFWVQRAFSETYFLNQIQTKVFEKAFYSDMNILLCAPTGAGKTNVAILTILQVIGMHLDPNGNPNINEFKIVYVAPMKALVSEIASKIRHCMLTYGITVHELSGDMNMNKGEVERTQILVSTPEKWDIITRNIRAQKLLNVKLVIIDEIHMLHDHRGPVIESIVANIVRKTETNEGNIRIIGLSATLPNFEDIATFLRVDKNKGLFFFDNSYRPCPLEQIYIGITMCKPIQKN